MIIFDDYALDKEKNYVAFSASALHVVDQDEIMEMGCMPIQWPEAVHAKIDFEKYDKYCVCIHEIAHGFYNRLTDYKGIWKLLSMPQGITGDAYNVERGRVYWGIMEVPKTLLWYKISNMCFLLPKGSLFPVDELKGVLEEYHIGFGIYPNKSFFKKLLNVIPNSYLMYYKEGLDHKLEIYGSFVESLFVCADVTP